MVELSNLARFALVLTVAATVTGGVSAQGVPAAQPDQAELARHIRFGTPDELWNAVITAEKIAPADRNAQLRSALAGALRKGLRTKRLARDRGVSHARFDNPELQQTIAQLVAEHRDPATIPILIGWVDGNLEVRRALASFGEAAASSVLQTVDSDDATQASVIGALITLRLMADRRDSSPLSARTLDRARQAARARLRGPAQSVVGVWMAMDLAVVLGDSELEGLVRSFATDQNAIMELGITDPDLVLKTQRRAQDLLEGIPPGPQW